MKTFEKDQEYPDIQWRQAMKKAVPVHAILVEDSMRCVTLEGEADVMAGSVMMRGVKGEYYPIHREKFEDWYDYEGPLEAAPVEPGFMFESGRDYPDIPWVSCTKKPVPVSVCQMDEPFLVKASWGDLEGKSGDYLAMYGPGDYAAIEAAIFAETYDFIEG